MAPMRARRPHVPVVRLARPNGRSLETVAVAAVRPMTVDMVRLFVDGGSAVQVPACSRERGGISPLAMRQFLLISPRQCSPRVIDAFWP